MKYMRVARTYRLEPELILRVEEAADSLGQSLTVFVTRALEKALDGLGSGNTPAAFGPPESRSVKEVHATEHPVPSRAPVFEPPPPLSEAQAAFVGSGVVRASSLVEQVSEPFYDDGETPGG